MISLLGLYNAQAILMRNGYFVGYVYSYVNL